MSFLFISFIGNLINGRSFFLTFNGLAVKIVGYTYPSNSSIKCNSLFDGHRNLLQRQNLLSNLAIAERSYLFGTSTMMFLLDLLFFEEFELPFHLVERTHVLIMIDFLSHSCHSRRFMLFKISKRKWLLLLNSFVYRLIIIPLLVNQAILW